ncbi:MAG: nitroreductase [Promethearchaeota archaeon]|nr:MAG: nitroreductase [Candidatus Lokiarchaeota archaeon]
MDFYEVIKNRRSYRFYSTKMPTDDQIERIIDAARLAPTWANRQGMEYVVVKNTKLVKDVWEAIGQENKFVDAPIFIVGIIPESKSGVNNSGEKYYPVDFGICFEHLILAATAEHLATCWIGYFNEAKIKEILEIPQKYRILGLTPLGYSLKPKGQVKDRVPLESILHFDKF